MSHGNPRNNQELLDKQFPSDEERAKREAAINAYADAAIRRDKVRGYPTNSLNADDGAWIFGGNAQR